MTTTNEGADGESTKATHPTVNNASVVAFRVLFGVMMAVSLMRFMLSGWIDTLYVKPTFFFKYWGFEWTVVWDRPGLYAHVIALVLLALMIAAGLFYRVATVLFFVGFAYFQLLDVTNYLNHYYLVVLLSGLLCVMPLHRRWSLDCWLRPRIRSQQVARWVLWLLRFQVALVYVNAAIAKVGSDWLFDAQPLSIWLAARSEIPIFGPLLALPASAYMMSWAGFLYDATIVFWLSWRRTRVIAYCVVLVFHGMTHVLFDIGMFPVIMPVATLLFFSPTWPLRLLRRPGTRIDPHDVPSESFAPSVVGSSTRVLVARAIIGAYVVVQVLVPLRFVAYGGDVLWHEQGMRWAWKVMVREKNGSVTYRVRRRSDGRVWQVSPHQYLTWRQVNEMSGQPDLIAQLGRHIAWDFQKRGRGACSVYVDALVSLNGRPAALMIDPTVDLTTVDDGIQRAEWILPQSDHRPARLARHLERGL